MWRRGETNPQYIEPLNSSNVICGVSTVTGILIWQGFLYTGGFCGQATVTGTLSSITNIETGNVVCGVSTLSGTLSAGGNLDADTLITCGSSTLIGIMDDVKGFIFSGDVVCGVSDVQGDLTSKAFLISPALGICGATTVTGSIINGTVYTYHTIGIVINDPLTDGLVVSPVTYATPGIGKWFFGGNVALTIAQPSYYQKFTISSTSLSTPKVLGEDVTMDAYNAPVGAVTLGHDINEGNKFWYLISATEYTSGQLVDILNNMTEMLPILDDGFFEYATFPWDVLQTGVDTYIYMIVDYRRNVSLFDESNTDGSSEVTGTLLGTGYMLGVTEGETTHIPATELTAFNIFFGGTSGVVKTKFDMATRIDGNSDQGSTVAYWNGVGIHRFGREYPNKTFTYENETAIMVKVPKNMFYIDTFVNDNSISYIVDTQGYINSISQGCFAQARFLERIYWPAVEYIRGPSGWPTLRNLQRLKGHVELPVLRGDVGVNGGLDNMNHIFNNAIAVEVLRFPQLLKIQLQQSSRQSFINMNGLKRVYMPLCVTLIRSTDGVISIFGNIPSGTIMYLAPFLETNDGGNRDPSVVYWEDTRGAIIRYVSDFTLPTPPTGLSAGVITETSFVLNFTPPTPNVNGNDFYEVEVFDGETMWQMFIVYQELTGSGDTVLNLKSGTDYRVRVRTADNNYNVSIYSSEVTIRTNGIRARIKGKTTIIGAL